MDYKEKLNDLYKTAKEIWGVPPDNKLQYIGNDIFGFITDDPIIDEMFAKQMIEALKCILEGTTSEYHGHGNNEINYINYLTMVNMPFLKDKIDYGISIRGAWFDEYGHSGNEGNYCINGDFEIPKEDIKIFIKELIEWVKE